MERNGKGEIREDIPVHIDTVMSLLQVRGLAVHG